MNYTVRNAMPEDLDRIEEIYAYAREYMAKTGNPNQWGKTNPPHEWLVDDIEKQLLHVIENETGIHGVFYFYIGEDPTYGEIEDGAWHSTVPYGTIHRIASRRKGLFEEALAFCRDKCAHIRVDTHGDNKPMQHLAEKYGFSRRGIIYVEDGTPRIAYELL